MGIVTEQQKLEQKLLETRATNGRIRTLECIAQTDELHSGHPSDAQKIKVVGLKDFRNSRDAFCR